MRLLPKWLIGEICITVSRRLDYPSKLSVSMPRNNGSAFRRRDYRSAGENLVIWKDNYDRKLNRQCLRVKF